MLEQFSSFQVAPDCDKRLVFDKLQLSFCMSILENNYLQLYLSNSFSSVYLPIYVSIYLYIYLSIYLSTRFETTRSHTVYWLPATLNNNTKC